MVLRGAKEREMADSYEDKRYRLPDICARCGRTHAPSSWDETVKIVEASDLTPLALFAGVLLVNTQKVKLSLPVCQVCELDLRKWERLKRTSKWIGCIVGAVVLGLLLYQTTRLMYLVVWFGLVGGFVGTVLGSVVAAVIRIVMNAKLVVVRRKRIEFKNTVFQKEFSALNPDF
jgi:hypothetical protein